MNVRCTIGYFYSLASLINLVDYSDIHVLFLINIQCIIHVPNYYQSVTISSHECCNTESKSVHRNY